MTAKYFLLIGMVACLASCSAAEAVTNAGQRHLGRHLLELSNEEAGLFDASQPIIVHSIQVGSATEYVSCQFGAKESKLCTGKHHVAMQGMERPVLIPDGDQELFAFSALEAPADSTTLDNTLQMLELHRASQSSELIVRLQHVVLDQDGLTDSGNHIELDNWSFQIK